MILHLSNLNRRKILFRQFFYVINILTNIPLLPLVEEHWPPVSILDWTPSWVVLSSYYSCFSYLLPILDTVCTLVFLFSFSFQDASLTFIEQIVDINHSIKTKQALVQFMNRSNFYKVIKWDSEDSENDHYLRWSHIHLCTIKFMI